MSSFQSVFQRMVTFVAPLLLIIIAAVTLASLGYREDAFLVSNLGTLFVIVGNICYVVFRDPNKRWKGLTVTERLIRLITFR